MRTTIIFSIGMFFCFCFSSVNGQKNPKFPQCPVYSITPEELTAGYSSGQVYPSISVSTLNNCTNYNIYNSYDWMSYVKHGLEVTVSVTTNSGYTPRSGCLSIGEECAFVTQDCHLIPVGAGYISGQDTVCQGETEVEYSVDDILYATGYNWSLPDGATITSGGNTNHITVSYSISASSGNVTVYGTNYCNMGSSGMVSPNFPVTVRLLPEEPLSISSTVSRVCEGDTSHMILTATGGYGTTLYWYKGNCQGQFLGTGNNIRVPVPNTPDMETYYARWHNDCGFSACKHHNVFCDAKPVASITQSPPVADEGEDWITLRSHVSNTIGNPTYIWEGPYNYVNYSKDAIIGYYNWPDSLGPYYFTYISGNGCVSNTPSWYLSINYGLKSSSKDSSIIDLRGESNIEYLTIYPNPTTGLVNISPNQFDDLEVTVFYNMGMPLFKKFNVSTINLSGNAPGTYLIRLKSNGKEVTRVINLGK